MDSRYVSALQMEIKVLKDKVKAFQTGTQYEKMRKEYEAIISRKDREIKTLKEELAKAHAQTVDVREKWFQAMEDILKETEDSLKAGAEENIKLQEAYWELAMRHDKRIAELEEEHAGEMAERDAAIEALKHELARLEAVMAHDGTNTGTPTSQTPPGKKKVIPNSRRGEGKKKGGQPGHKRHIMQSPDDAEVDETLTHKMDKEGDVCPKCGSGNYVYTGKKDVKYEVDVEIKVVKKRHEYFIYKCLDCGEEFTAEAAPYLKTGCQYGPTVQALSLSLLDTVNAAINKVPLFLSGMTGGEIRPSEGYIAKLQKRGAKGLRKFYGDLRLYQLNESLLFWDDTVIMIDTRRGCLRFYGNDRIAYYTAHEKKDLEGLKEDRILELLSEETKVMHDHNKVNYNEMFRYYNLECNQHLQRDLQKSADDTGHTELLEVKSLISKAVKERKDLINEGKSCFDDSYVKQFKEKLEGILRRAEKTNTEDFSPYSGQFEANVIKRIRKYYDNYFLWLTDFTLPTTNNLSERGLRCVKTHMKVSGQFANVKRASDYAVMKTYIETCRRNGINEVQALQRLCEGNPYTVAEIMGDMEQKEK